MPLFLGNLHRSAVEPFFGEGSFFEGMMLLICIKTAESSLMYMWEWLLLVAQWMQFMLKCTCLTPGQGGMFF